MNSPAPWKDPAWKRDVESRIDSALEEAGRPRTGPIETTKSWGRSCLQTVTTAGGTVWIKHGYGLPPGEDVVLPRVARRWPDRVPAVIASWPGSIALAPLPGAELEEAGPAEDWIAAARRLAELEAGESAHVDEWIGLGVRDRRPELWEETVSRMLESPVVEKLEAGFRKSLDSFVPEFIERYTEAFTSPATLVHQDSGCCNIHMSDGEPIFFDWADVVVGHPVFSCDRLLDQTPEAIRESVIDAFREPLGMTREEFRSMRRSGVLHEVVRYHDELAYIAPDDPMYESLAGSVRSQLRVLVEFENSRRSQP